MYGADHDAQYGAPYGRGHGAARGPAAEPPLWAPYYGAPFRVAALRFVKKYADFTGRASRSEYWWTMLLYGVVLFGLGGAGFAAGIPGSTTDELGQWDPGPGFYPFGVVLTLWLLATIVPTISLAVRRLHDINLSGLAYLLCLIPYAGGLILTILALLAPRPEGARFDRPTGVAPPGGPAAPDSPYGYGHQPGGSGSYPPPAG